MLGIRIALARKRMGISQAQLAKRLHISPSAVGMYEQGRREPPADVLVALSAELDVSIDYLLTGKDHHKPEPDPTLQLLEALFSAMRE